MRNVRAGYRRILCRSYGSGLSNSVSFLSYFLNLTPPVNGFTELPATLVSELGCHIGILFKRVGFF